MEFIITNEGKSISKETIFPITKMQLAIEKGFEGHIMFANSQPTFLTRKPNIDTEHAERPLLLNIVSGNSLRKKLLSYLNNSQMCLEFSNNTEDEMNSDSVDLIAQDKIKHAVFLPALAIDSLTMIPGQGSVKKPTSFQEILSNLNGITHHEDCFYYINSSAALKTKETKTVFGRSSIIIGLNKEGLNRLIQQEFITYLNIADQYQDHSIYPDFATSLFNVGGGIALPILFRLKLIDSINGVPISSPNFAQALNDGYKTILFGGGNSLYSFLFGLDSKEIIEKWPWYQTRVQSLLDYLK